jgi:para-nitrobenzyl esterase
MTEHGPVRGVISGGILSFASIPYAAPPIGALRWRSPLPPAPWTTALNASQLRPACFSARDAKSAEDCLYLSVTVPLTPYGALPDRAPVMVFLHGGGLTSGSTAHCEHCPPAADYRTRMRPLNMVLQQTPLPDSR